MFVTTKNKFAQALPLHERAISVMEKTNGPDSAQLANILIGYAMTLEKLKRIPEAMKARQRSESIRNKK